MYLPHPDVLAGFNSSPENPQYYLGVILPYLAPRPLGFLLSGRCLSSKATFGSSAIVRTGAGLELPTFPSREKNSIFSRFDTGTLDFGSLPISQSTKLSEKNALEFFAHVLVCRFFLDDFGDGRKHHGIVGFTNGQGYQQIFHSEEVIYPRIHPV